MEIMNDFEIVIKRFSRTIEANEGVSNFIAECNNAGDFIKDITSHVNIVNGGPEQVYTFIFKVKRDPRGKAVKELEKRLKQAWDEM